VANGLTQPYRSHSKRGAAALYDPAASRWTVIGLPHELLGAAQLTAAWTGRDIIVASIGIAGAHFQVAAYEPAAARWTMITPKLPRGHLPQELAMVGTPDHVLLWTFWARGRTLSKTSYVIIPGVDLFALARSGRWTNVTGHTPQAQYVQSPVDAGGRILYLASTWCGSCSHPAPMLVPRLVSAATRAPVSITPGQLRQGGDWLWTGASIVLISWPPRGKPAMAAYDPATRTWHLLARPPRDQEPTPVWAGRQLLALTSAGAFWAFHR